MKRIGIGGVLAAVIALAALSASSVAAAAGTRNTWAAARPRR